MINTDLFVERLEKVIKFHNMSASQFGDRIGVQRSSISHLLTGRNKPSLEFVMKLVTEFPEVNLYWLLYGKGNFPEIKNSNDQASTANKVIKNKRDLPLSSVDATIKKIIILHKDGSFEVYENDKL